MNLTEQHRQAQLVIRAQVLRDLARLWPAMDWSAVDRTFPLWAAAVGAVVARYRTTSSSVAGAYLRAMRFAAGHTDTARIIPAPPIAGERLETSLKVTTALSIKANAAKGTLRDQAMAAAFVRSAGAVSRLVLEGGQDTVRLTVASDPRARGWRRVTSGKACGFCSMLAGRDAVYKETTAAFEAHDHCVLPDTLVNGPSVEVGYRRWYEGELVIVRTASGDQLSITPNHPVLTSSGWVDAGLIQEGQEVVQRTDADLASLHVPHEHDVPARIEDVWRALRVNGLRTVPVAPEDFHGDGTHGEVEVVTANGLLSAMFDAQRHQLVMEPVGARAGPSSVAGGFFAGGDLGDVFVRSFTPSDSGVSGLDLGGLLGRREPILMNDGCLVGVAASNSGVSQPPGYDATAHPVTDGQALLRLTGDVPLNRVVGRRQSIGGGPLAPGPRFDPPPTENHAQRLRVHSDLGRRLLERLAGGVQLSRVINLCRVDYSGHVFNLQTAEGWYDANSLVVSNCSCSAEPVFN